MQQEPRAYLNSQRVQQTMMADLNSRGNTELNISRDTTVPLNIHSSAQ